MQEEQDTCRICSAPAEPDQPLFYPCKCSGTIRYIHQDCLTTWLAHSKKKTCDVCKHPYSFTKVYSPDMPARLPITLVLRRLAQQAALGILFGLRAIMVGTVWLAFLPWATLWTWRMYFSMGDATAWWIADRARPIASKEAVSDPNVTSTSVHNELPPTPANATLLTSFLLHPTVRNVSADIVTGQIIASVIILGFVAVFLLREWISQNARPGVFDDAELPPEEDERVVIPPVQDVRQQPVLALPAEAAPIPPDEQIMPLRPEDVVMPPPPSAHLPPAPVIDDKGSSAASSSTEEGDIVDRYDVGERQRKMPRHADYGKETPRQKEKEKERASPQREHKARQKLNPLSQPMDLNPEQTQFTFSVPVSPRHNEPLAGPSSSVGPNSASLFSSSFPAARPESPYGSNEQFPVLREHTPAMPLRRPPLPGISLPPTFADGSSATASRSRTTTPLASPSLATYSAPEEFEAGPSNLSGYFTSQTSPEELRREHDQYFREPSPERYPLPPSSPGLTPTREDEEVTLAGDSSHEDIIPRSDDDFEEEEDGEDDIVPFGPELPPAEEAPVQNADNGEAADGNEPPRIEVEPADQEELDANLDDDMDGALEAIGLRGPIYGVLQNAAFMTFVLDGTIGLLVWLPFTMGKTIALLSLDPPRLLHVINSPLRAIRLVTDPIVDLMSYLITRMVFLPLSRVAQNLSSMMVYTLSTVVGQTATAKGVQSTGVLYNRTMEVANFALNQTLSLFSSGVEANNTSSTTILERLAENDSAWLRLAEPYFAPIGRSVREKYHTLAEAWVQLAIGDNTSSKLFAICLGYALNALVMAIYLNVLTFGSVKSAGRAVRSAVRQQLLVIKVASFIIVELVVFPLGCGVMLDACTVWLFPNGSFRSRTAFLMFAPVTAAFYHWVIGTMFMYQFAVLLAGCRGIMRPGAMWFIKDPQDQNFHPIRDILERPTLVQIRKLLISALMYGVVVASSVATISGILRVFSRTIMPFRWTMLHPLSEVPIDLLFLHLVMPYTLHYFRPKKFLYKTSVKIWKFLAAQLRLSSYMFGDRYPLEEVTPSRWNWRQMFLPPGIELLDGEASQDGTFWRVPNNDNVALVRNERATVEVDENGMPKDAEGRRVMALLNAEAAKAKRDIATDYTIVYVPPRFRWRIISFILCLWTIGSVVLAGSLAIPILLGRGFFGMFTSRPIHDGYSFIAGFYLLWACLLFGRAVETMDRRRQRRGGGVPRARLPLFVAKRGLIWFVQVAYLALFLGVVIPTLIAMVVELYMVLPVRFAANPEMQLRIRMADMWALGLLYTKIALKAHQLQVNGPIARGIEQLKRNGWAHPEPLAATKDVIIPLTGGLLAMILVPPFFLWSIQRFLQVSFDGGVLFLHVYPTIFIVAGFIHSLFVLSNAMGSWSQSVRDKEFLVEMRLQNLEPDQENKIDTDVSRDSNSP
ncbi:hypothetical protein K474DRAFT_1620717 [Panus rudis PR-1116 ss-1]|nr:hypothetical protein K474DRAFT_1620717 [Panus rudis PR-1116 ss-1]